MIMIIDHDDDGDDQNVDDDDDDDHHHHDGDDDSHHIGHHAFVDQASFVRQLAWVTTQASFSLAAGEVVVGAPAASRAEIWNTPPPLSPVTICQLPPPPLGGGSWQIVTGERGGGVEGGGWHARPPLR